MHCDRQEPRSPRNDKSTTKALRRALNLGLALFVVTAATLVRAQEMTVPVQDAVEMQAVARNIVGAALAPGVPRYIHGERAPEGSVINAALNVGPEIEPGWLSQIGDDVYLDSNDDGVPEIIVANAYHDAAGNIMTGSPSIGVSHASNVDTLADPEQLARRLWRLRRIHAKALITDADLLRTQSKILARLQPETLGVEGGLSFLADLWEAGLISAVPYGIKRHEMLDAL